MNSKAVLIHGNKEPPKTNRRFAEMKRRKKKLLRRFVKSFWRFVSPCDEKVIFKSVFRLLFTEFQEKVFKPSF